MKPEFIANQSLRITNKGKKTLSKSQQLFNKLTARVELLERTLEADQAKYDLLLHIMPPM